MNTLRKISGFMPYITVVSLNAITDLGHKIVIQNTVFKSFDGPEQIGLTAIVNALILLPFILLFTPSAFISDRFSKNKVIKMCAAASIPLTMLIVICYYQGLFWAAFGLTFLLAAQSALYSPAKYGYIKEMTGNGCLTQANAAVQAVTIVSILAGAVVFSMFFEYLLPPVTGTPSEILKSIAPCGFILVAGAILETIVAFTLPEKMTGDAKVTLDKKKYIRAEYLKSNMKIVRENKTIWLSIVGLATFWAVNQVFLAVFGAYLKDVTGENNTVIAQGILSIGGLGIIVGSILAGRVSKNYIETGTIPLGAVGMTICLYLLPSFESKIFLTSLIFCYGVFGGMLIVPLNSLIQFSAKDGDMGKVLAGNNFIQNICMLGFLGLTFVLSTAGFSSVPLFYILATITFIGMVYTIYALPQSLIRYLINIIFSRRYSLSVSGLDNFPAEGGVLLVGNHVSWIDWAVLSLAVPRRVRFVMAYAIYDRWYLNWFLKHLGVIPVSPRRSKTALKDISTALSNGDCVAIFPEGAISRNGQLGEFKRGFEGPAQESGCTIIPFYLRGLWGSTFSFATPRLREMSRIGKTRDVTVCFGESLPSDSSAFAVKNSVTQLSIDAWRSYAKTFDPIHIAWLKAAKSHMAQPAVSDSTGATFSNRKLLATCILAAKLLKKNTNTTQNIGVLLPASAGGVIANMTLLMLGKTIVNLNYTSSVDVLKKALDRAEIHTVVTSQKFLNKLSAKGFDLTELLKDVDVFYMESLSEKISKTAFIHTIALTHILPTTLLRLAYFRKVALDSTAAILFSSGSEGTPKGVMLSHQNIMGNIKQVSSLFNAREDDVFLGTLPLFHAFGLTVTTFMPLIEGIPVVCHPDPTDAAKIGRIAAEHKATFLCATPTFLGLYARNRRLHPLMFSSLRLVVAGAEKMNNDVRIAFKEKFGLEIYEGYGTTETTPVASVNTPDVLNSTDFTVQISAKHGTVGLPLPGSAFRVVDPQTLEDLPEGEAGLILIGGTQIMKGYLNDPQKTAEVIVEQDGVRWYKSGDKGQIDPDGFLVILDRYSRFAKIGGEMISLTAVEEAILKVAPEEIDVIAVAIPDPKKGERIVALVHGMDTPSSLKGEMLEAGTHALSIPAKFFAVEEVPKLGTGKKDLAGAKKMALKYVTG